MHDYYSREWSNVPIYLVSSNGTEKVQNVDNACFPPPLCLDTAKFYHERKFSPLHMSALINEIHRMWLENELQAIWNNLFHNAIYTIQATKCTIIIIWHDLMFQYKIFCVSWFITSIDLRQIIYSLICDKTSRMGAKIGSWWQSFVLLSLRLLTFKNFGSSRFLSWQLWLLQ